MPPVTRPYSAGNAPVISLTELGKPRIERLAEDAEAFRQDDAVEAILQRIVLGADMQLAELILHDARRLQEDLVERVVVAAGHGRDGRFVDRIGRCAELSLDAAPRFIEFAGGDDNRLRAVVRSGHKPRRHKKDGAGGTGQ